MPLIPTLFFNTPRGTAGPTQQDPGLKWVCLSLCNYLPLRRLTKLSGRAGSYRKGTTFLFPHAGQKCTGQGWLPLGSGKQMANLMLEQKVWSQEYRQTSWRGSEKVVGTEGRWKGLIPRQRSLPGPTASVKFHQPLCLLGEDHKPHAESLTSQWEFVYWGTGDCRSSQVCQPTPFIMLLMPYGRIRELEPCKEREQAVRSSLLGPASGLDNSRPCFHSLAYWTRTPSHTHSELYCS